MSLVAAPNGLGREQGLLMAGRMMMTVPVCEDVAMRFGASAGDKDQARPSVYAHKTSVTRIVDQRRGQAVLRSPPAARSSWRLGETTKLTTRPPPRAG